MDVVGLKMEDTELSLGLGLGLGPGKTSAGNKRGFSETNSVDLKLNLNTTTTTNKPSPPSDLDRTASSDLKMIKNDMNKSATGGVNANDVNDNTKVNNGGIINNNNNNCDPAKPPSKAQVVGWPPVRSYRKNMLAVQKSTGAPESETDQKPAANGSLVKVSMDGAPYLRKVDLKLYMSYQDLSDALGKMFSSFTLGNYGAQRMIDFMNESKLMDVLNGSDYVPTYEDKDGDWMLVGDVPWEMFVESCKRLRIMKGKEAAGLAPRAMEKCKNRI